MEFTVNMTLSDFIESNPELAYELLEEYYPQCIHKVMDGWYEPTEYPQVMEVMNDLYEAEHKKMIQTRSISRLDHNDYLLDKMCEYA